MRNQKSKKLVAWIVVIAVVIVIAVVGGVLLFADRGIKVGKTVVLGTYEQDGDKENGTEPLEWLVLAKEEGKVLLTTVNGINCVSFGDIEHQMLDPAQKLSVWDHSALREMLNSSFIEKTFTAEERSAILTTTVKAEKNPNNDNNPGADTEDKVFLLGISEVLKYYPTDESRQLYPTAYAKARGVYTNEKKTGKPEPCWWWLRTPGGDPCNASFVNRDGTVNYKGFMVTGNKTALRPAMWVDAAALKKLAS